MVLNAFFQSKVKISSASNILKSHRSWGLEKSSDVAWQRFVVSILLFKGFQSFQESSSSISCDVEFSKPVSKEIS